MMEYETKSIDARTPTESTVYKVEVNSRAGRVGAAYFKETEGGVVRLDYEDIIGSREFDDYKYDVAKQLMREHNINEVWDDDGSLIAEINIFD